MNAADNCQRKKRDPNKIYFYSHMTENDYELGGYRSGDRFRCGCSGEGTGSSTLVDTLVGSAGIIAGNYWTQPTTRMMEYCSGRKCY